jgi:hypothetical protein
MSSIRKSSRTPIVPEKLKESAGTKRAAAVRGSRNNQTKASTHLNTDNPDSETASNEDDDPHGDEEHAGGQGEGGEDGGVGDENAAAPNLRLGGVTANDADATAGNTDGDGAAKRRKKGGKRRKDKSQANKKKDEGDEDKESDAGRGGQQGMDEGWLDDTDAMFGDIGDDGEDLSGDSSTDDIFVSSAARFELLSQGAMIFSSVVHGSGRDAPVGSLFIILHEGLPGAAKNLFPVCLYQVSQTPSDPEGLRRAARVATSFPDMMSSLGSSKRMSSDEVTAIDFLPDTGLLLVGARGWAQAQKVAGSYLRFALPAFFLPVTFLAVPKIAATKAQAVGTGV